MELIKIKNLTFGYTSRKNEIENISLNIEKGKFTCIIGENGSGKSTLLKCILGLNKGYKGEIIKSCKAGYLPQITEIQNNFPASIEEIVLSGTIANNPNKIFYKKEDKQKAKEVMEQLGIYEIRKKSFADLSGGQKQRVLIARAMCLGEQMLILDEPTNGLDPNIANQIYTMLNELKNKNGLTILMVSHDTYRALEYADRVIEMENGKVKFDGKATDYKNGGDR